jgi:hypothetical protein
MAKGLLNALYLGRRGRKLSQKIIFWYFGGGRGEEK